MTSNRNLIELLERQMFDILGEYETLIGTITHLRQFAKTEGTRADNAEVTRDTALRQLQEAKVDAAAAAAGATNSAALLEKAQEELITTKKQLEMTDRMRCLLEQKCEDFSTQLNAAERELLQLRPLKATYKTLQNQYLELKESVHAAIEETQAEVTRLQNELRRVEHCASAGIELRERARLAAAAHAREKHLLRSEQRHISMLLLSANAEAARLNITLAETRNRMTNTMKEDAIINKNDSESEIILEMRAALEAERAGAARLEKTLATALADNAALASLLANVDNSKNIKEPSSSITPEMSTMSAIDSFLAD